MDELIAIVRELVKREPWNEHVSSEWGLLWCEYCEERETDRFIAPDHKPDCPWARAKKWLEEHDGRALS